jgi:excisionase family DNA binding protein
MTVSELCRAAGVHRFTIYQAIQKGNLSAAWGEQQWEIDDQEAYKFCLIKGKNRTYLPITKAADCYGIMESTLRRLINIDELKAIEFDGCLYVDIEGIEKLPEIPIRFVRQREISKEMGEEYIGLFVAAEQLNYDYRLLQTLINGLGLPIEQRSRFSFISMKTLEAIRPEVEKRVAQEEFVKTKTDLLSVQDIVRHFGNSQTAVRKWIQSNELKAIKTSSAIYIEREEFERFCETKKNICSAVEFKKNDNLMSVKEVAGILNVTKQRIEQLIRNKQIQSVKGIGKRVYILKDSFETYLKQRSC